MARTRRGMRTRGAPREDRLPQRRRVTCATGSSPHCRRWPAVGKGALPTQWRRVRERSLRRGRPPPDWWHPTAQHGETGDSYGEGLPRTQRVIESPPLHPGLPQEDNGKASGALNCPAFGPNVFWQCTRGRCALSAPRPRVHPTQKGASDGRLP